MSIFLSLSFCEREVYLSYIFLYLSFFDKCFIIEMIEYEPWENEKTIDNLFNSAGSISMDDWKTLQGVVQYRSNLDKYIRSFSFSIETQQQQKKKEEK